MNQDEEALLRTIRDDPDNDTPRLIWADWLQEDGQADRAEFVRLQIELWHLLRIEHDCGPNGEWETTCPACGASSDIYWLCVREAELMDLGLTSWNVMPGYVDEWRWERGLIGRVSMKMRSWIDHGPSMVQWWPLRKVEIADRAPMEYAGAFIWHNADHPLAIYRRNNIDLPFYLPSWIFDRLTGHDGGGSVIGEVAKQYLERGDAIAAFEEVVSDACLEWARSTDE